MEKKVTEDMPIETVPGANLEEAVDVEVTKIMKEKRSTSGGFDDSVAVHDRASDDVEEGEMMEV
jgi:hypothetical protein